MGRRGTQAQVVCVRACSQPHARVRVPRVGFGAQIRTGLGGCSTGAVKLVVDAVHGARAATDACRQRVRGSWCVPACVVRVSACRPCVCARVCVQARASACRVASVACASRACWCVLVCVGVCLRRGRGAWCRVSPRARGVWRRLLSSRPCVWQCASQSRSRRVAACVSPARAVRGGVCRRRARVCGSVRPCRARGVQWRVQSWRPCALVACSLIASVVCDGVWRRVPSSRPRCVVARVVVAPAVRDVH